MYYTRRHCLNEARVGEIENARHENVVGLSKMRHNFLFIRRVEMRDMKMRHSTAGGGECKTRKCEK